jgi:probable rRNA maturation factor
MPVIDMQIEASADQDVPPRSWDTLCAAAMVIARSVFPHGTIALRIVTRDEIRQLNRMHRSTDCVTDVLSFPAGNDSLHSHRGDIALCWPAVEHQAAENGNSEEAEAIALIAHGLLHLAGHDHDSDEADALMTELTVKLCREAGIEVQHFGH